MTKKKPYQPHGFLDTLAIKRSKEMEALYKLMLEGVGLPCPAFDPGCCSCRAWSAFATLDEFFDDESRPPRLSKKERDYYAGAYRDYLVGE